MSYINSYQFDLDQELAAERASGYGPCPRCGGHPDMDETGRYYTCFFCCDRGTVPMSVVLQEERTERDYREQFRPQYLGSFPIAPAPDDCYLDEDDEHFRHAPGHRLFTSLIPPVRIARPVVVDFDADDIPF